jgi:hypothetical protein
VKASTRSKTSRETILMSDRQPAREPPVARPTIEEGDLYVFSEEDAADIASEVYCFAVQYPGLDRSDAEELATYVYELMTGNWESRLTPDA